MKEVIVLAEAAEDIERGRDFYEEQAEGIGRHFTDSILADIGKLSRLHGAHAQHFGFYRMLATRFPFGIYYQETDQDIRVIAIVDLRREPIKIQEYLARHPRN